VLVVVRATWNRRPAPAFLNAYELVSTAYISVQSWSGEYDMESKRVFVCFLLSVAWLLVAGSETMACQCAPESTPCEAYGDASSVFVGHVTSADVSTHEGYSSRYYEIKVEEVFLGTIASIVRVSSSSLLCGYEFERDKHYLIYTYGDLNDGKEFSVTYCSRTRPLDAAADDLEFLRSRPGLKGGRIYGTIERLDQIDPSRVGVTKHPAAGIRVRVEDGVSSRDVVTDENGWYEVVGMQQGAYRIEAKLPEGFLPFRHASQGANINDCGCARRNLYIYRR